MPGRCIDNCPTQDLSSYYNAWSAMRNNFGPRPDSMVNTYRDELYNEDYGNYLIWLDTWNNEHGVAVGGTDIADTIAQFSKWMQWRCTVGTPNYANLPERLREHVGISCVPCPYDDKSSDIRAEHMLGAVPTQVDHDIYYMRVALRGTAWGFECTYDSCPYYIANGRRYFYA
jgi:hypothetical protein